MKTSDLTGAALDWAVAKCEGVDFTEGGVFHEINTFIGRRSVAGKANWSTDWAQGGPIIEREKLCIGYRHQAGTDYCPINDASTNCWARTTSGGYLSYGPTPLIAAMRCFCAAWLGDEIEIPKELT